MRFADGPPRWLLVVLLLLFVIRFASSPLLITLAIVLLLWTVSGELAESARRKRRD